MPEKIKVLFVDDSPVALELYRRMVSGADDIDIAGTALNGLEALKAISELDPDIICTDLHMPKMDGLELTREVMQKFPRPILVISVSVKEGSKNAFDVLEAGAVDVLPKPQSSIGAVFRRDGETLLRRIRILAGVHVVRRWASQPAARGAGPVSGLKPPPNERGKVSMVGIGASTGGPQALQTILSRIPVNFPAPIVCIQHIGEGFLGGLVEWLNNSSSLKVCVAEENEVPRKGVVYFAGEGRHLLISEKGRFTYSMAPPVGNHRPSITLSFRSMASYFGSSALGVLITGMGSDGAEGLKEISDAGGLTIAQDEATSIVYGMPKTAVDIGAAKKVLPLERIAMEILKESMVPDTSNNLTGRT